jgi:hypothetical protein
MDVGQWTPLPQLIPTKAAMATAGLATVVFVKLSKGQILSS